jgi:signal transduction histidine kinase
MQRTRSRRRGWALSVGIGLALAAPADAKKFQMSGTWIMRKGSVFVPLQFLQQGVPGETAFVSMGNLTEASMTPSGDLAFPGQLLQDVGGATATGAAPQALRLPKHRFVKDFGRVQPQFGSRVVQLMTMVGIDAPADTATLEAGGAPGALTWCPDNPACVAGGLPAVGRVVYAPAGALRFGGTMQMGLWGGGVVSAKNLGPSHVGQVAHVPFIDAGACSTSLSPDTSDPISTPRSARIRRYRRNDTSALDRMTLPRYERRLESGDPMATMIALLIEDEPLDAVQVRRTLCWNPDEARRVRLEHVTTLGEGIDRLGKGDIDVVLLDLHLPDSRGIDTVLRLREHDEEVPIVVLSVDADPQLSLEALRAGAQDYLPKDELSVTSALSRSIRHAIERQRLQRGYRGLSERLSRTEKTASLGVLAAGMAMGFNRLLGEVLDAADASLHALHEPASTGRQRRRLEAIRRAALRAGKMVGQLRDYAIDRRSPLHPIDLSRAVLDSSEFLDSLVGEGVELTYDLAADAPAVRAGRVQLHQILLSLVTNACEAIGSSTGKISISTGRIVADAELLARSQGHAEPRPGFHAFLRVTDSGCGIPAIVRPRIFDPFFTTKHAGRGLGLSAVLGILRELGAFVLVDSRPGRGSCFTVFFPAEKGAEAATATTIGG